MLAFILIGLFESDEFASLFLPLGLVELERLGNDTNLTACLDDILNLVDSCNSVVDLVVLTIFDTNRSDEG